VVAGMPSNEYAKETCHIVFFFQVHSKILETLYHGFNIGLGTSKHKSVVDINETNARERDEETWICLTGFKTESFQF
jgi:hypothetical protein